MDEIPWPYPWSRFPSKHNAEVFIEDYKRRGYIRPCAHFRFGEWGGMIGPEEYGPECVQNSFSSGPAPFPSPHQSRLFYGCPAGCRLFVAAWRGHLSRWVTAATRGLGVCLSAPFWTARWLLVWFSGLPAITQALIVVVILVMFGVLNWQQVLQILEHLSRK